MLNKVILMGRLTKDPELQVTPSGVNICSVSLAVTRDYAKPGEDRETDFINVVAFNNRAVFVSSWIKKGQLVAVCGRLQTRTWEDGEGKKRYATEVVADEVHFAESKKENTESAPQVQGTQVPRGFDVAVEDDDLPF